MSPVIRITTNLYQRLGFHAKGFETPSNVIEKILNFYEEKIGSSSQQKPKAPSETPTSLQINYYPTCEDDFKQSFLKTKKAYILMYKTDGTTELKEWNVNNFADNSSVNGNLRSGHLRGWKEKGIFKAEISTNKDDLV